MTKGFIVGPVMAMARPPRPLRERMAVLQAAEVLTCPSNRAKAAKIARQVAVDAVAYLDADPVEQRLGDLHAAFAPPPPSPITTLARCPEIDTVGLVARRRAERFEARGYRQIGPLEWVNETQGIISEVSVVLAERYRRFLT